MFEGRRGACCIISLWASSALWACGGVAIDVGPYDADADGTTQNEASPADGPGTDAPAAECGAAACPDAGADVAADAGDARDAGDAGETGDTGAPGPDAGADGPAACAYPRPACFGKDDSMCCGMDPLGLAKCVGTKWMCGASAAPGCDGTKCLPPSEGGCPVAAPGASDPCAPHSGPCAYPADAAAYVGEPVTESCSCTRNFYLDGGPWVWGCLSCPSCPVAPPTGVCTTPDPFVCSELKCAYPAPDGGTLTCGCYGSEYMTASTWTCE